MKAYSNILFDITKGENIPEAQQNPAYDLLKSFSLTSLELGDFYDRWLARGTNPSFDLRYATCQWMVENWDLMETFIPRDFPRVPQENEYNFDQKLYLAAVVLAVTAVATVIATSAWTHVRRDQPAVKNAQIGFLWILLVGLFLVAAGAVSSFLPPSKVTCTLTPWFINLGYTMELVPLIVKVAAIQKLMQAAKNLRRVNVNMRHLYFVVVGVCFIVVLFLGLWTLWDAPNRHFHSKLSRDKTESGETMILMTPFCASDSIMWRHLATVWHSVLLVAATLLAFQTRKLKTDFGETETLGIMVYSHVVFVALRLLTYLVQDESSAADTALYRSLIFSCSILSSVGIYFVPKFLHKEGEKGIYDLRTTAGIPNCMREAFAGQVNRSGLPGSSRRLKFEEDIYGAEPAQHPEMGQNNIAMDDPSSARLSRPPIENIAEGREEDLSKSQDIESPSAPDKLALHRDTENSDEGSGKTKELLCQYCGREMESLIGKAS